MAEHEVIIVGGGPAGLTAGLYTSRAGLKSLLLERGSFGGQMVNATMVENYPGFPEGIAGFDLGSLMHQQALRYGLETLNAEVTGAEVGPPHRVLTAERTFETEAIIVASGSQYRKLNVSGEDRMMGRGVSYCATCDGFLFRDQEVAVVGGGDTAITDALELSQHAQKVYVIHRRDQLRAGQVLQQRALAEPKIEFIWNSVVEQIVGDDKLSALALREVTSGRLSSLSVDGVFIAVGLKPNSDWLANVVELTETGHIVADVQMGTSAPGIFAAGDVRSNSARQIAAAVGDGATAAKSAFKYLRGY